MLQRVPEAGAWQAFATRPAAPARNGGSGVTGDEARAPRPPVGRPRILVVDDDKVAREMTRDALSSRYEVLTAVDGFDATASIFSDHPDLIVLDLEMPRVNGLDVLRAMRRAGSTLPVLVVSGRLARATDRLRVLALGATDVLAKPVHRFELLQKIDMLLRLPTSVLANPVSGDVERMLADTAGMDVLDDAAFERRIELASRFQVEFGLDSTIVAVESDDVAMLDALLELACSRLRAEDSALRLSDRRALLLLCASAPPIAPVVLRRLARQLAEEGGSAACMRCARHEVEPFFDGVKWDDLFVELAPWPPPEPAPEPRPRS